MGEYLVRDADLLELLDGMRLACLVRLRVLVRVPEQREAPEGRLDLHGVAVLGQLEHLPN